jgi:ATP-binding cassette, subfamily B, bacterial
MKAVRTADANLYRQLALSMRPYRFHLAGILLLSLVSSPLALLAPLPLKIVVDSVLGSHPPPHVLTALVPSFMSRSPGALLALAAGLLIAIALVSRLQDLAGSVLRAYTAERLVLGFRARLFAHAQRLSLSYHDTQGTADSTYRIQYDAPSLQYITVDGLIPLVTATVTLASMLVVTARVDWQLALVALAISPALFFLSRAYRRRLRSQAREVKRLESLTLSVLQEVLTAVRVVKAFGQEDRESERFVRESSAGVRARLRLAVAEGGFGLLVGLLTASGTAAVLLLGVRHVRSGTLTLGNLLLVLSYLAQLYEPLKTMSRKAASLQSHLAGAERAYSLLAHAPEVPESTSARRLARAVGEVTFHDVSFGYGAERQVLQEVSFHVEPGMRLGIAGTTGAGKTTLVNLLARFYDPTAGQILLDGVDLRDYRLADLRNQYAIVLQETVLFSTSIAENIAYARPNATEQEIVAAAEAANAHAFISRLPDGYDTRVGERGMRLSGGERQRIALARAFLKDAPLLIFDEPTSAVDVATEATIIEAMERLMRGRTTFLITHRVASLAHCDRVLIVEGGRLVTRSSEARSPPRVAPGGALEGT